MRIAITFLLRLVLRVFYKRIEVSGLSRLPATGPCIVVLNHPNGLVDPLFILCLSPRPASFLAKAPLFKIPLVGLAVRALDSIPVYRKQDEGGDPAKNQETFAKARDLLAKGGILALFPEGTSHDDPKMRPLKTGAARIALGAAAQPGSTSEPLRIIAAGLTFSDKGLFRSDALLQFGEPFPVPCVALGETLEPPASDVLALTERIEEALEKLVLQADHQQALLLSEQAESVFTAAREEDAPPSLSERVEIRQRMLTGYSALLSRSPRDLESVANRIKRHHAALDAAGLSVENLSPSDFEFGKVLFASSRMILTAALLIPAGVIGFVVNYPAYRATGWISKHVSKDDISLVATTKVLASLLLFPLTWLLVAAGAGFLLNWLAVPAALLAGPVSAWAALRVSETFDQFAGGARAVLMLVFRKRQFLRLHAERREIRQEILRLAKSLPGGLS